MAIYDFNKVVKNRLNQRAVRLEAISADIGHLLPQKLPWELCLSTVHLSTSNFTPQRLSTV